MSEEQKEPFGFDLWTPSRWQDHLGNVHWSDRWVVMLPHQCDEWTIACSESREEVLAELDRFIAEVTETRRKLAEYDPCEKCGHDLLADHRRYPDGPDGSMAAVECLKCEGWDCTD